SVMRPDRPAAFPDADGDADASASGADRVLVSGGPSRPLLSFRCAQTVGEHAQNSTASALRLTTNLQHAGGDHHETLLRYRCGTVAARAYRLLAFAAGVGPGRRGMGNAFRRLEPE